MGYIMEQPPAPSWAPTFTAAWDEVTLGLLPCDCEQSWLPLAEGGYTRCPRCTVEDDV